MCGECTPAEPATDRVARAVWALLREHTCVDDIPPRRRDLLRYWLHDQESVCGYGRRDLTTKAPHAMLGQLSPPRP